MTHNTEQERAEFEAWYIKSAQKAVPAFSAWSDIEVRDGCMRPDGKSYKIDTARIAWEAWQAARRAPAVPVPQCEPVGSVYTMEALVPGGREVHHVSLYMPLPAGTKLYAAPQPPEAAPVQLPEPAGWIDDGGRVFWNDGRKPNDGEIIYTEQQVRQLLAAHGIKVNQ